MPLNISEKKPMRGICVYVPLGSTSVIMLPETFQLPVEPCTFRPRPVAGHALRPLWRNITSEPYPTVMLEAFT